MNKYFLTFFVCCLAVSTFADVTNELTSTEVREAAFEVAKFVQEKCTSLNQTENYHVTVLEAMGRNVECIKSQVDIEDLQSDIESQIRAGVFEGLFNATCQKRNVVFQCIQNEEHIYNKCLTDEEIADKDLVLRVLRRIVNTVCVSDGDMITLFLVQDGQECIDSKKDAMLDCLTDTFSSAIESPNKYSSSTYINEENCDDLTSFHKCIVPLMAQCSDSVPATLIDGIFAAVSEELTCPIKEIGNEV